MTENPYDRPSDPAKRRAGRAHRRLRARRCPRDAEGGRLHRRRPRQAADRRRHAVDRDDAVQPEPARARAGREARDPRGGRDAGRVQHGVRIGRRGNGDDGHARVPRLARPHRDIPRLRRLRRAAARGVRLEQDDALGGLLDGARRERHPRARAGLAHRPLRPARAHPRGHGRSSAPASSSSASIAGPVTLLPDVLHDGGRLEPRRLPAHQRRHRRVVPPPPRARAQHQRHGHVDRRPAHAAGRRSR